MTNTFTGNNSEKKKGAKKHIKQSYKIPQKLQVALLLFT